ncbi:MAG TPA: flagellar biosynthetic protein FliO [Acidimicrobiia bacterium]|jgi:flagellar protein FliO/FliZ
MPDSSMLGLLARLVLSLAVVIGLMFLLASVMRKRGIVVGNGGRGRAKAGGTWNIDVLARKGLGRTAQLAVVRAGGKTIVIGITEQRISMLAEADPDTVTALEAANSMDVDGGTQWTGIPGAGAAGSGPSWKTALDAFRDRTVRR